MTNCLLYKMTGKLVKVFLTSLIFISCSSSKNNGAVNSTLKNAPLGGWEAFDKQGHRGCRGLMPENTIPAMLNALGLGVNTLEMDISISKDKKVFLSHEPFFNHEITTTPNGEYIAEKDEKQYNLYAMDYAEIVKIGRAHV